MPPFSRYDLPTSQLASNMFTGHQNSHSSHLGHKDAQRDYYTLDYANIPANHMQMYQQHGSPTQYTRPTPPPKKAIPIVAPVATVQTASSTGSKSASHPTAVAAPHET